MIPCDNCPYYLMTTFGERFCGCPDRDHCDDCTHDDVPLLVRVQIEEKTA